MWDSESGVRMIKEWWELERIHLHRPGEEDTVSNVPMNDVVEMEFGDGMKWEWKLKNPLGMMTPVSMSASMVSTPGDDWMNFLEDDSWYTGSFLMSDTSSESGFSGMG
tara:strand:- start:150 stop:473 length:324 start_codon:yes stop_codon:yes gene_type:complete